MGPSERSHRSGRRSAHYRCARGRRRNGLLEQYYGLAQRCTPEQRDECTDGAMVCNEEGGRNREVAARKPPARMASACTGTGEGVVPRNSCFAGRRGEAPEFGDVLNCRCYGSPCDSSLTTFPPMICRISSAEKPSCIRASVSRTHPPESKGV